jgi:hypothetical protein
MMMMNLGQQGQPGGGQPRFEQYLGNKYAKELQEMQRGYGAMHQSSHNLKDADFMLGHLVTQGINNLATVSMNMRRQAAAMMQAKQALNAVGPVTAASHTPQASTTSEENTSAPTATPTGAYNRPMAGVAPSFKYQNKVAN